MLQDLHSHTYYSFCGKDAPETIVEAAIRGGLSLFGICDHNSGITNGRIEIFQLPRDVVADDAGRTLKRYYDHINAVRERYRDKITVLRGIEICTIGEGRHPLPENADISYFDYCLIENLDAGERSWIGGDLFGYAEKLGCKAGVAHTDLFAFIKARGEDPYTYFKKMAERGIFWEMNVSYDSIHHYREHAYMLHFFEDEEQQEIVRRSGVEISIGFDGHRTEDYAPERICNFCRRAEELGLRFAFES